MPDQMSCNGDSRSPAENWSTPPQVSEFAGSAQLVAETSQADSRQLGNGCLAPLPQVLHDALVINDADIATHTDPVRRGRTNYIVRLDLTQHDMPGKYEQMWTRTDDKRLFELCCIPFFPYGQSLGDTLEIDTASRSETPLRSTPLPGPTGFTPKAATGPYELSSCTTRRLMLNTPPCTKRW